MIHPNMATMLSYIATDAAIEQSLLQSLLSEAVEQSFNAISVDGDTSTNDSLVLMATGKSGVTISKDRDDDLQTFKSALLQACVALAQLIVRDGEGATKFVTVQVDGGKNQQECRQIGFAIAHSPLVKTALFASDPNWGRILAAVGRAGVNDLDVNQLEIYLGEVCIVANGGRAPSYTEEQGKAEMAKDEILIRVHLHRGESSQTIWTCDFSYDYVRINADYRS
jgi:glutamate N-acetyltransferase/amino-acid N-acetyltransferase